MPTVRNIVHVIGAYLPQEVGGTQLHLRDLCREQRQRGHRLHVFTGRKAPEDAEYRLDRCDWDGIPVTRLNHNFRDCDRFEKLFSNAAIDECFRRFLHREDPDIVHIHHLSGLSISMIGVAKEMGCTVVLTLQDYWLQCPRGQRIYPDDLEICTTLDRRKCVVCLRKLVPHLLPETEPGNRSGRLPGTDPQLQKVRSWEADARRWVALCDAVIAPSSFHRERFVEWGLAQRRCAVVPHGLPREKLLAEPRGRRPIRNLGYLGTVIPTKGVHVLVEAFNLLDRSDLVLDIHGEATPFFDNDSYQEELRSMVRPGLTVRFHGRYDSDDLPRILATLDLLVVPSLWWESFCLTAREGALAGLPVIVSNLAGLADAVAQGIALGFDAGDAKGLAGQIDRLCSEEELRDTMSRRAAQVVGISRCAEEIESLYGARGST